MAGIRFDLLREMREDAMMPLREVAEATGKSIAYISQLERGAYPNIRLDMLERLAQACDGRLEVVIDVGVKKYVIFGG
jgi:transcriptional regulator with XRE-family HTH domain